MIRSPPSRASRLQSVRKSSVVPFTGSRLPESHGLLGDGVPLVRTAAFHAKRTSASPEAFVPAAPARIPDLVSGNSETPGVRQRRDRRGVGQGPQAAAVGPVPGRAAPQRPGRCQLSRRTSPRASSHTTDGTRLGTLRTAMTPTSPSHRATTGRRRGVTPASGRARPRGGPPAAGRSRSGRTPARRSRRPRALRVGADGVLVGGVADPAIADAISSPSQASVVLEVVGGVVGRGRAQGEVRERRQPSTRLRGPLRARRHAPRSAWRPNSSGGTSPAVQAVGEPGGAVVRCRDGAAHEHLRASELRRAADRSPGPCRAPRRPTNPRPSTVEDLGQPVAAPGRGRAAGRALVLARAEPDAPRAARRVPAAVGEREFIHFFFFFFSASSRGRRARVSVIIAAMR